MSEYVNPSKASQPKLLPGPDPKTLKLEAPKTKPKTDFYVAADGTIYVGDGANVSPSSSHNIVNPLENIKYTDKVKAQMKQGDYHAFPEAVDSFGADGTVTKIVGGDGVVRTKVEISGGYRGRNGIFEYIIEPNQTVNHRFFRPIN